MNTQIIELDGKDYKRDLEKIQQAANLLKAGKLVAFPTETVYGLGADALNRAAAEKIYAAKGRPSDNPLIVHLANADEIEKYAEVTDIAKRIIDFFMPAPLTLVLKKKEIISDAITGGRNTVAVRVPKDKTARKLIELAGIPVAAPSANLSGKPSPTRARDVILDFYGRIDAVLCGDDCEIGIESTVIAFDEGNKGSRVCILRSGAVTKEMLEEIIGAENVTQAADYNHEHSTPKSPGMKYAHYSPDAPLYVLRGGEEKILEFMKKRILECTNTLKDAKYTENTQKIGFLCYNEIAAVLKSCDMGMCEKLRIIELGRVEDLAEQARNFFKALNEFNSIGVDVIYATEPNRTGIGEAVFNRLEKASGGRFIEL